MSSANPQGLQAFPEELTTREAWLEPFDWYREMRAESPVRYDSGRNSWDVFRYADVKRVLDDDETFSTNPRLANDFQEPERMGEGLIFDTMLFQDPPRHDELRGVVDDAFQPRALRNLEPYVRELAADLLDDALATDDSGMELIDEFAYPLPVIVIAKLLGVPADERDRFKRWSDTLVAAASADEGTEELVEHQQQAQQEMALYFLELIEDRREDPQTTCCRGSSPPSSTTDPVSPRRRCSGCASCCSSRATSRRRISSRTRSGVSTSTTCSTRWRTTSWR